MSVRKRLADWMSPRENRNYEPSWDSGLSGPTWPQKGATGKPLIHGARVSAIQAESLIMVQASINVIAQSLASLPAFVYDMSTGERRVDESHNVSKLIKFGPNDNQTWPEFIDWFSSQALLHGNGLAEIVEQDRNTGEIKELRPHPWRNVTPRQLSSGRLVYDVIDHAPFGVGGKTRRLLDTEVIHLKDRTDDGLVGRSRISRSPTVLRTALSIAAFDEIVFEQGAFPTGFIQGPFQTAPGMQRAQNDLAKLFGGVYAAGKIIALPTGHEFKPVSPTLESLQLVESKRLLREEIATLFGIPLPIVNVWDHSSFTNSVEANKWFANYTLAPWAIKIQEVFRRAAFGGETRNTHELRLDLSAFLRGDAEARWNSYDVAVRNGILTRNEIRAEEGFDPLPDLENNSVSEV